METLNLYKDRRPYKVLLNIKGKETSFEIPTELTVEESERLIELEIRANHMAKEEAGEKDEAEKKLEQYFNSLLDYIQILLSHYQPEITLEKLKGMLTQAEIIKIFDFFRKQRFIHIMGLDQSDDEPDSKKKLNHQKNN